MLNLASRQKGKWKKGINFAKVFIVNNIPFWSQKPQLTFKNKFGAFWNYDGNFLNLAPLKKGARKTRATQAVFAPYCVTLPAVSACVRRLLVLNLLLINIVLCCTIYMQEVQYMNVEDWKSQIKRGTLDYCILLLIKQRPYYGYEIISKLEQYPIVAAKENTIYPLLRRLLKEEYISSSWQESTEGLPPRKYYTLTEKGNEYLSAMSVEWDNLLTAISEIKGELNDG